MEDKKDMIQGKISVSEISKADWKKIRNDLHFIDLMSKHAEEKGCRLIVSGGYATDGCLGKLTRPHRDIDIQIYGQDANGKNIVENLVTRIKKSEPSLSKVKVIDKGREEFYHSFFAEGSGLGSDIYYIQVTGNPFDEEKYVIKKDGSYTEKQGYKSVKVTLEGISFEAIDPSSELEDIIYKREVRGDKPKPEHDQDIANLKLITKL